MVLAPGHAHLTAIKILHRNSFLAPRQLVPRHCSSARNHICNRGHIRGFDQTCTATRVMLTKLCTMTAKSAPYPPCTVTGYRLKYQDPARCLRRVTQPPHIAGPLWLSASDLRDRYFLDNKRLTITPMSIYLIAKTASIVFALPFINFTVTNNFLSIYQDWQKPRQNNSHE